jgi:enoyl-CoA hydratase/carnithine racemase
MPLMSGSELSIQIEDSLATVRLSRQNKRNALHLELVNRIGQFFAEPPPQVRIAVLIGEGALCAGLDLAENRDRTVFQAMENSSAWHRASSTARIPVVAALHAAVIGGGLELALAAHVRVADLTAFYSFPEGGLGPSSAEEGPSGSLASWERIGCAR